MSLRHAHVATLLAASGAACAPASSAPPSDSFDRNALLASLAQNVFLPAHAEASARAAELPVHLAAYCDALDAGAASQITATQLAARASFATTIDAWQRVEAAVVGPAAMDDRAMRHYVYGWPLLSPCELDRDTASRWASPAGYDVSSELVNARSLAAVEYLLYPPSDAHACVAEPPGWNALGAALPRARCRLAHAISIDVAAKTQALFDAWRDDGGGYARTLASAGRSGSAIRSAQLAVNAVSDAMFYVDSMVKDMKLGEAAGIAVNACDAVGAPCLREVELRYADRATHALRANLRGLRATFTGAPSGTEGAGFDDFLIAVGHPELAAQMTSALELAIARADALPESFLAALTTDYVGVVALHQAVRAFTDDLKSQFLTVLALEIPDDSATDND